MKKSIFILLTIMALVFVGCSDNTNTSEKVQPSQEENNSQASEVAKVEEKEEVEELPETKPFTFMLGEEERTIEIPYEAKKLVVIGYDLIDIIDSLGHKDKIVGVPDPSNPMFPEFLEGYEMITSVGSLGGDDLEAIAGLQPDLILAGARAMAAYDDLAEIAPTIYFTIPGMNGSNYEEKMSKNIEEVAYILNEEAGGFEAIGLLQEQIASLEKKVQSLDDIHSLFLILTGKTVNVYTDNLESRYGFVYNEFGFEASANVEEISEEDLKVNDGEASRHGNSISFEFISAKNPDYIIVLDRGAATAQEGEPASDTLNNPLIHGTNAYKNDNIIYLDGAAWYLATGGIEATHIMLKNLSESLE